MAIENLSRMSIPHWAKGIRLTIGINSVALVCENEENIFYFWHFCTNSLASCNIIGQSYPYLMAFCTNVWACAWFLHILSWISKNVSSASSVYKHWRKGCMSVFITNFLRSLPSCKRNFVSLLSNFCASNKSSGSSPFWRKSLIRSIYEGVWCTSKTTPCLMLGH